MAWVHHECLKKWLIEVHSFFFYLGLDHLKIDTAFLKVLRCLHPSPAFMSSFIYRKMPGYIKYAYISVVQMVWSCFKFSYAGSSTGERGPVALCKTEEDEN